MNNPTVVGLYRTSLREHFSLNYYDYWDGFNWHGSWRTKEQAINDIQSGAVSVLTYQEIQPVKFELEIAIKAPFFMDGQSNKYNHP